jgi:hypothetical protein
MWSSMNDKQCYNINEETSDDRAIEIWKWYYKWRDIRWNDCKICVEQRERN